MRAASPEPIRSPKLPAQLESRILTSLEAHAVIEECRLDASALTRSKASSVRFDGVHLVGVALEESELADLSWQDVHASDATSRWSIGVVQSRREH
jgi:uncharacterized protein YjbI with pentapeptide repeats